MSTQQEKVDAFFARYPERAYSKGQIIVWNGEISKYVFYITSGKIKKCSTNYKGEEIILTTFKAGRFFPIAQAMHQNSPNRYVYIAETDVTVRPAAATEVADFLMREPDVMFAFMKRIYNGLDEMLGRIISLIAGNALSRVVYEIIVETRRFGVEENEGQFFIDVSEKGLAARAGLSRETVNREVRKLKAAKLVRPERRGIVVLDLAKLETKLYKELL